MRAFFPKFLKDNSGATAIEYALIAGFISISIIAAATAIGVEVQTAFKDVDDGFKSRTK